MPIDSTNDATELAPVQIGLASFAHMHGVSYGNCMRRLPGVELVGAFDEDANRCRKFSKQLGNLPSFDTMEQLLEQKPDAVVVCCENVKHRELTEQALEAGVAVLCEKPLATTLVDARAMVAKALERGVSLATAFPCRFHPVAARTRRAIQGGEIGTLRAVSATNHGQVPPGWFTDPVLGGGGAIMDHTVHVVDLLRWMTGAEVVSVYAESGKLRTDLAVEDLGLISLRMSNDVVVTLDASWSRPGYFPTWGDVTMEMIGAEGVLSFDLFAQNHAMYRVRDAASSGPIVQPVRWLNWGDDMDNGLVTDFVCALRAGTAPSVTGEDGLRALEVALAAYASVKQEQVITLPLE